MGKLVLIRHGQSVWNKKNIFTGWIDIGLSEKGIFEALEAGDRISEEVFDIIYTSTLVRAKMTAFLAMSKNLSPRVPFIVQEDRWSKMCDENSKKTLLPVMEAKELNERYYGELQGKNKDQVKKEVGVEQFVKWRRSYDVEPPAGESLKMTIDRVWPFFESSILPRLESGENVLIAAHGNSIRGIVMHLDNLNKEEIVKLEIPTGEPIFYVYEDGKFLKKS